MIELKSGKINALLLKQLKDYHVEGGASAIIDGDERIAKDHKQQAKRVLRQQRRLGHVKDILSCDAGIDPGYEIPIRLSEKEYLLDTYDHFLNELCDEAVQKGRAGGTVQWCVHIAVGFHEEESLARRAAVTTMRRILSAEQQHAPDSLSKLRSNYERIIPVNERYRVIDAAACNLVSIPCRPFVLWTVKPDHLLKLVERKLCVLFCFDVISHIWLAQQLGVNMALSSKSEAADVAGKFGGSSVPMWGNRVLTYEHDEETGWILGGHLSRLLNDLDCPASVIRMWRGQGPTIDQRLREFQTTIRLTGN